LRQGSAQVDRRRRLANTPLLVGHRQDAGVIRLGEDLAGQRDPATGICRDGLGQGGVCAGLRQGRRQLITLRQAVCVTAGACFT